MDPNLINGVLRAIIPAAVAFAHGKGWLTGTSADTVLTIITTLGAAGWSIYTNLNPPTPAAK